MHLIAKVIFFTIAFSGFAAAQIEVRLVDPPCDQLLSTRSEAPVIDGFKKIRTEYPEIGGELFTLTYRQPLTFNVEVGFLLGDLERYVDAIPGLAQFGFANSYENAKNGARVNALHNNFGSTRYVRLAGTQFLNNMASALKNARARFAPEFTFVGLDHRASEQEFSDSLAERKWVLYDDPPGFKRAEYALNDPGTLFYHDRGVHAPFAIFSARKLADSIVSRHSLLKSIREILAREPDAQTAQFFFADCLEAENRTDDSHSAELNLLNLRLPLDPKVVAEVAKNPKLAYDAAANFYSESDPTLTQLGQLYLMARNARSMLEYKNNDEIYLRTVMSYETGAVEREFNLATSLSPAGKKGVYELWLAIQHEPRIGINEVLEIRAEMTARINEPANFVLPPMRMNPSANLFDGHYSHLTFTDFNEIAFAELEDLKVQTAAAGARNYTGMSMGSGLLALGRYQGTSVFLKTLKWPSYLEQLRLYKFLADQGIGPKVYGVTKDLRGNTGIVLQFIDGIRLANRTEQIAEDFPLSKRSYDSVIALKQRLVDSQLACGSDLQLRLTPDGQAYIIDPENMRFDRRKGEAEQPRAETFARILDLLETTLKKRGLW